MQKSLLIVPLIIIFSILTHDVYARSFPHVKVANEFGVTKNLRDLLQEKSILVMGYYNCKHMCNFLIKDLTRKLESFNEYPNVIYFGIDENEGPRDALFLKKRIFGPFKRKWTFLVADKVNINKLASFLNFELKRDPVSGVINHELGLYAAEGGNLIRKLPDVDFQEKDMLSPNDTNLIGTLKKFCSEFDPRRSKYGTLVVTLLSASSALFLMLSAAGFFYLKRNRA